MEMPEAGVITAVFVGVAGLVTAIAGVIIKLRQMSNAHALAIAKLRADQYLVDHEELEDLRWWRRLAIKVLNQFLDDYATRQIEPPLNVHDFLDYPPVRPASRPPRRKHLDE